MRIVVKTTVDRDFMGGKTTTTKLVVDDADALDLLRLLGEAPQGADRRLGGPGDPGGIAVTAAMEAAGRQVFLSPERVEALRETLGEVYRAMERARRSGR